MIKLKDIAEKYGEYGIDENKLKEILIESKPKTIWDLKENDNYYMWLNGKLYTAIWGDSKIDHTRAEIGNIFLTKEEAEFERERLKVETELLRYGGTRDMMSLNSLNFKKFFIDYDHDSNMPFIGNNYGLNHQGTIYFKTYEDAENAINHIGEDRIKKYIFNVKE